MKVGQDQLKAIPPGTKVTYKVDHPREFQNIRSAACYTALTYPELGIRFKTSINRRTSEITIEAIPTHPKDKKSISR